jgi:hypothetical protein
MYNPGPNHEKIEDVLFMLIQILNLVMRGDSVKYSRVFFRRNSSNILRFNSKRGDCSTHLKSSLFGVITISQRLIQSKKETTIFTRIAQLIEVRA